MFKPGQQSTHRRDGVLFLPAASGTSARMERIWIHRMGVVLVREDQDWAIVLIEATPVQPA
jgi:hypothetical protein